MASSANPPRPRLDAGDTVTFTDCAASSWTANASWIRSSGKVCEISRVGVDPAALELGDHRRELVPVGERPADRELLLDQPVGAELDLVLVERGDHERRAGARDPDGVGEGRRRARALEHDVGPGARAVEAGPGDRRDGRHRGRGGRVDDDVGAEARARARAAAADGSAATTVDAPIDFSQWTAPRPMMPRPKTTATSPGRRLGEARRAQRHGQRLHERAGSVGDRVGQLEDRLADERPRHQHALGERARDAVADVEPAAGLAQVDVAGAAAVAFPARRQRADRDAVAVAEALDAGGGEDACPRTRGPGPGPGACRGRP